MDEADCWMVSTKRQEKTGRTVAKMEKSADALMWNQVDAPSTGSRRLEKRTPERVNEIIAAERKYILVYHYYRAIYATHT